MKFRNGIALALLAMVFGCAKKEDPKPVIEKPAVGILVTSDAEGTNAEELVSAYEAFLAKGFVVQLLSPEGDAVTLDPASMDENLIGKQRAAEIQKFLQAHPLKAKKISDHMKSATQSKLNGLYIPGGQGLFADLADPETEGGQAALALLKNQIALPIAAVSQGPAVLVNLRYPSKVADATDFYLTEKIVTAATAEGAAATVAPIGKSLDEALKDSGAKFVDGNTLYGGQFFAGMPFTYQHNLLVTGQNTNSAEDAALALVGLMEKRLVAPSGGWVNLELKDSKELADLEQLEKEVYKEANFMKRLIVADLSARVSRTLKVGQVNPVVGSAASFEEAFTIAYVLQKKNELSSEAFMAGLNQHVNLVASSFESMGLKGYWVYTLNGYEVALMNWTSKAAMEVAFKSAAGQAIAQDAEKIFKPNGYGIQIVFERP